MLHLASRSQMFVGTTTKTFVTTAKRFCNNLVSQSHSVRFGFCRCVARGHMKFESASGFWRVSERIGVGGWAEIYRFHNQNAGPPSSTWWALQIQKFGRRASAMSWDAGARHMMSAWLQLKTASMLNMNKNDVATWHLSSSSCQSTKPLQTIEDRCPQRGQSARPLTCTIVLQIFYASNSSLFNACSPYAHEKKKDTCCPSVLTVFPQTSYENCRN